MITIMIVFTVHSQGMYECTCTVAKHVQIYMYKCTNQTVAKLIVKHTNQLNKNVINCFTVKYTFWVH